MAIDKQKIIHHTECLPDVFTKEIYVLDDMKYEIMYDHTGKRMFAQVLMYNDVKVCGVGENGTLSMQMPTGWVTSHKEMTLLISDIQRLDEFLAAVVENYH